MKFELVKDEEPCKDLQVRETKIDDPYNPEQFDSVNLDFYIDDTLIGEASISGVNTDDAFLYDVEVFPKYRGKGYANLIFAYILKNYSVTNLTVKPNNKIAINLYKKFGFVVDRHFDDSGEDMLVMIRRP